MKELEKTKNNMYLTILYRAVNYLCWFLFATAFTFFIRDEISDWKIFGLILALIIIYASGNFMKYLYREIASKNYYDIKHGVELHYLKKSIDLDFKTINNIDLNSLSNDILKVSYLYTKFIYNIGEYLIPCFIGVIIIFITLINVSWLMAVIVLLLMIALVYYKYTKLSDNIEPTSQNNLLKDFINNLFTIKTLNLKNYMIDYFDQDSNNTIDLNKEEESDIFFNNGLLGIISIVLLSICLFVNVTITKLGLIIFFLLMAFKMQKILYHIAPSIKIGITLIKEKDRLDNKYQNNEKNIINNWKKIDILNGIVKYESGVNIKIPNFTINSSDTISIMGKSGQGKSTVLNVLCGISDLDEGNILIDGNCSNDLVDAVYISKEPKLFNISLKNNLTLGREISDEELLGYFKEANLLTWYNSLEKGFDTICDNSIDDKILLKLSLIRGIIMNKEIYFLDCPTEGMDTDTEKIVVTIIKKHLKKKTLLVVSDSTILTNICKKHYFIKDHTLLENEPLL